MLPLQEVIRSDSYLVTNGEILFAFEPWEVVEICPPPLHVHTHSSRPSIDCLFYFFWPFGAYIGDTRSKRGVSRVCQSSQLVSQAVRINHSDRKSVIDRSVALPRFDTVDDLRHARRTARIGHLRKSVCSTGYHYLLVPDS